jgi:hypothetical protein
MKRYTRKVNGKIEWEYHKLLPDEDAGDLIRGACLEMGFVPIDSGIYALKTDEGFLKVIWQGEERHGWIVEINNYSEMFFIRQSLFDTIRSVWSHERKNPLASPPIFSSKEIEEILG